MFAHLSLHSWIFFAVGVTNEAWSPKCYHFLCSKEIHKINSRFIPNKSSCWVRQLTNRLFMGNWNPKFILLLSSFLFIQTQYLLSWYEECMQFMGILTSFDHFHLVRPITTDYLNTIKQSNASFFFVCIDVSVIEALGVCHLFYISSLCYDKIRFNGAS